MKVYPRTRPIQRYITLDIHRKYVFAGGMNVSHEWILPARRIELSKFGEWARKDLCESDAVVIETTTNVWDVFDIIQPLACHAVVAPMNSDTGKKRGYRKTKGGRPEVRRTLYMATLTGIRYNPVLKPHYDQLVKRGKEKKVAITACMRKMLTILNAMMRDQQPFRYTASA